jgi:hypothetical protein
VAAVAFADLGRMICLATTRSYRLERVVGDAITHARSSADCLLGVIRARL